MKKQVEELAVKRLEHMTNMGVCENVLTDYKRENLVYYSERTPFGGMLYWCNENGGCPKEVVDKITELKEKYDTIVYHVTHEFLEFGECWDLWCVSDEDLEYEDEFENDHITFAYVLNTSDPQCSEFGSIAYKLVGGGAVRVG